LNLKSVGGNIFPEKQGVLPEINGCHILSKGVGFYQ